MGGKEAKERRRLKRLALQQQAEASGSTGGGADAKNDSATPNKSGTTGAINSISSKQPPSKKMKPTSGHSANGNSPKQQHSQNGNAKGKFGGGKGKFGGKPSNAGGKHKGKGGGKSGQQQNNSSSNKKKFKKPKHLKRKLEALSGEGGADEEKERIRLQQQMRQLEENKAERAKRFETKMKNLAGDKFDAEVFAELTAKGASKETIHKIVVEGEKMKEKRMKTPKKTNQDGNVGSNKKQKKMAESVDIAAVETKKNDEEEHETPSESSSADDSDDSGSDDISLENIEDISDEECDVYILDPEEVAKKKQKSSQEVSKEDEAGSSSESDDSESDSDDEDGNEKKKKSDNRSGNIETEKEQKDITNAHEKSGWSDSDEGDKSSSSSDDSEEDSSNSSSSDDDSDMEEQDAQQKRTRGRGRKGRRDADNKRETSNAEVQETKKRKVAEEAEAAAAAKETPTKDKKKRRCIGRKPVTDFIVGQTYEGEVVYVKPFGAFIDIGCHSDAFCHISRVADDYVESIEDFLSPGDKVSPRIVEIDRKQKRLTVSLQSSARIVDEKKSIEDRKERLKKNSAKKAPRDSSGGTRSEGGRRAQQSAERPMKISNMEAEEPVAEESRGQFDNLEDIPESEMTPAQLKRARKLARRAERRKQQELTGMSA